MTYLKKHPWLIVLALALLGLLLVRLGSSTTEITEVTETETEVVEEEAIEVNVFEIEDFIACCETWTVEVEPTTETKGVEEVEPVSVEPVSFDALMTQTELNEVRENYKEMEDCDPEAWEEVLSLTTKR